MSKTLLTQIQSFLFSLSIILSLIQSIQASSLFTERLEIYPLKSSSLTPKALWHFDFEFQSDFDPSSFITQESIPPRTVLESVFIYSNVTDLRLEIANGKPNSFVLDEGSFYFSLPKEGKTVFADQYVQWGDLMYQLQEIFSLSVQQLPDINYYKYDVDLGISTSNKTEKRVKFPNYEKTFLYGHDPVDYICNDFVEKIHQFSPCKGTKGLFTLLKVPEIFGSDYVSSSVSLNFDREAKRTYFKVEFNVIGHSTFLDPNIAVDKCHGFHLSEVVDHRSLAKETRTQEKYNIGKDTFTVFKMDNLPGEIYSKDLLKSQRYLVGERFHINSDLVHEITNLHSSYELTGFLYEYLRSYTHPSFHTVSLTLNDTNIPVKNAMEIEYSKEKYALMKFAFKIPPKTTLKIKIPFEKLLRSFENYPHDPARGEDMIPGVILYRVVALPTQRVVVEHANKVYRLVSNNLLIEMPHSDFSMVFTNIAVSMAMIGFLSMTIYRAIFENPKKVEESKIDQLKRFIKEKLLKTKVKSD